MAFSKLFARTLAAFLALLLLPALASAASWRTLGSKSVDFSQPAEEIAVRDADGVRHLVVETRKAGVILEGAWIHFAGGEVVEVKLRETLTLGQKSKVVAVPEGKGEIEKVVVRLRSRSGSGRAAELTLLGKA